MMMEADVKMMVTVDETRAVPGEIMTNVADEMMMKTVDVEMVSVSMAMIAVDETLGKTVDEKMLMK